MLKRVLCLFLSVLMVFSMLPLQTLAMEDNTQPTETFTEPVATVSETEPTNETIPETEPTEEVPSEATIPEVTVSEETVPEETIPETTVTEEMIPEETVPETTVFEETVSEVTVPETIPENTVPEETVIFLEEITVSEQVSSEAMLSVTATDNTCGENLTWTFDADSEVLTISGTGAMANYNEEIPPLGMNMWKTSGKSLLRKV